MNTKVIGREVSLRICNKCILPETFPGIKFDEQERCNYCHQEKSIIEKSPAKKIEYRDRLHQLIKNSRDTAPSYDVIMAYSGGKDSSYTLKLLREKFDLRILAVTFDNHFLPEVTWNNISAITDALSVDHISFRPHWNLMKSIFTITAAKDIFSQPTLLRASSICTACIGIVKNLILKTAVEMAIPFVAFGWSPGQAPIQSAIMKTNPAMVKQGQKAFLTAFPEEIGRQIKRYTLSDNLLSSGKDAFPVNIHPLAFYEYNEKVIKEELDSIGWKFPADTDTNSTNCLINAYANHVHLERHRFHPYVWEIANMVRHGVMSREEGVEKIYTPQNTEQVEYARKKLGI